MFAEKILLLSAHGANLKGVCKGYSDLKPEDIVMACKGLTDKYYLFARYYFLEEESLEMLLCQHVVRTMYKQFKDNDWLNKKELEQLRNCLNMHQPEIELFTLNDRTAIPYRMALMSARTFTYPPRCKKCKGRGYLMNMNCCQKCGGDGVKRMSHAALARACMIDYKSWKSRWEMRYEKFSEELTGWLMVINEHFKYKLLC